MNALSKHDPNRSVPKVKLHKEETFRPLSFESKTCILLYMQEVCDLTFILID